MLAYHQATTWSALRPAISIAMQAAGSLLSIASVCLIPVASPWTLVWNCAAGLVLLMTGVVVYPGLMVKRLPPESDQIDIGTLIDALPMPVSIGVWRLPPFGAANRLMEILPRLTVNDFALLTSAQLSRLHGHLNPSAADAEPYFAVAILKALERVGDCTSLPYVKRLSERDVMEPVRGVAQRCLPELRRLVKEQQAGGTLLRACEPANESLLRPASSLTQAGADTLLRPHEPMESH